MTERRAVREVIIYVFLFAFNWWAIVRPLGAAPEWWDLLRLTNVLVVVGISYSFAQWTRHATYLRRGVKFSPLPFPIPPADMPAVIKQLEDFDPSTLGDERAWVDRKGRFWFVTRDEDEATE